MITKIKRAIKMATVQRQRREHKEALLLQRLEETNKRITLYLKEVDKGIKETDKSIEEYYKKQSKYITA